MYFQELCRLSKYCPDTEDQIIWCNSSITFLNNILSFKHWSRDGLVFLSDVLNRDTFCSENIAQKLSCKAAMLFEVAKLKVALKDYQRHDSFSIKVTLGLHLMIFVTLNFVCHLVIRKN